MQILCNWFFSFASFRSFSWIIQENWIHETHKVCCIATRCTAHIHSRKYIEKKQIYVFFIQTFLGKIKASDRSACTSNVLLVLFAVVSRVGMVGSCAKNWNCHFYRYVFLYFAPYLQLQNDLLLIFRFWFIDTYTRNTYIIYHVRMLHRFLLHTNRSSQHMAKHG